MFTASPELSATLTTYKKGYTQTSTASRSRIATIPSNMLSPMVWFLICFIMPSVLLFQVFYLYQIEVSVTLRLSRFARNTIVKLTTELNRPTAVA